MVVPQEICADALSMSRANYLPFLFLTNFAIVGKLLCLLGFILCVLGGTTVNAFAFEHPPAGSSTEFNDDSYVSKTPYAYGHLDTAPFPLNFFRNRPACNNRFWGSRLDVPAQVTYDRSAKEVSGSTLHLSNNLRLYNHPSHSFW